MRSIRLVALAVVFAARLAAQSTPPEVPAVLLVGSFRTPIAYEAALQKLDAYYQEQVGRKLPEVLPALAPRTHYEAWHDMWITFAPESGTLSVTLKRQTDRATLVTAKGWMLQLAGRVDGELPLRFEERASLRLVESEIAGSRRDVARALKTGPAIGLIDSWQYAGLLVSPDPLIRIQLVRSGSPGIHHLTVAAETAAEARRLSGKIAAAMAGPCLCAAYSETAEIDEDLRKEALEKSQGANATTAQYLVHLDPAQIEETLRAQPETQKRLAAAANWVAIRYRVDRAYPKVRIRWSQLDGYSRGDGQFAAEIQVGVVSTANVRPLGTSAIPTTRTHLSLPLRTGAYRIAVESVGASGEVVPIERRDYWFDGKTFEEM